MKTTKSYYAMSTGTNIFASQSPMVGGKGVNGNTVISLDGSDIAEIINTPLPIESMKLYRFNVEMYPMGNSIEDIMRKHNHNLRLKESIGGPVSEVVLGESQPCMLGTVLIDGPADVIEDFVETVDGVTTVILADKKPISEAEKNKARLTSKDFANNPERYIGKRNTNIDIDEIKRLALLGYKMTDISKKMGVTYQAVFNAKKRNNIKVEKNKRAVSLEFTEIIVNEMKNLHKAGKSYSEISRMYKCSVSAVSRHIRK